MKIFNVTQGSDEWFKLRRGWSDESSSFTPFRFTASQIYCLSDLFRYKSREDYLNEVTGVCVSNFESNEHIERGVRLEPKIRKMYEEKMGVSVTEVGFVVPSWCPFIGVSPDGLMDEGCIEIKAPVRVYEHPKPEHYAQMQMVMAVCERDWCDYVVYSERDDELKITKVLRDVYYWENTLYPQIKSGIRDGLEIILENCISDMLSD